MRVERLIACSQQIKEACVLPMTLLVCTGQGQGMEFTEGWKSKNTRFSAECIQEHSQHFICLFFVFCQVAALFQNGTTQYPVMTKWKNYKQKQNKNLTCTKVFTAFSQYSAEVPLVTIKDPGLLESDATSLAHLFLGFFSHSSFQNLSSSIRLDGEHWGTDIFRPLQRCSVRFKSGL